VNVCIVHNQAGERMTKVHGPDWQPRDRRTLTTLIGPRCRFITGPRDRQWRLGESQGRSAFADRCAGRTLTRQGRAWTVYSLVSALSRGTSQPERVARCGCPSRVPLATSQSSPATCPARDRWIRHVGRSLIVRAGRLLRICGRCRILRCVGALPWSACRVRCTLMAEWTRDPNGRWGGCT